MKITKTHIEMLITFCKRKNINYKHYPEENAVEIDDIDEYIPELDFSHWLVAVFAGDKPSADVKLLMEYVESYFIDKAKELKGRSE